MKFSIFCSLLVVACQRAPQPPAPTDEVPVDTGAVGFEALSCADGSVAKVTAGAWACGSDADSFSAFSCPAGQVLKSTGSGWQCAADADTNVDTDTLGALTCDAGRSPVWNGSAWACSGGETRTLSLTAADFKADATLPGWAGAESVLVRLPTGDMYAEAHAHLPDGALPTHVTCRVIDNDTPDVTMTWWRIDQNDTVYNCGSGGVSTTGATGAWQMLELNANLPECQVPANNDIASTNFAAYMVRVESDPVTAPDAIALRACTLRYTAP